ncbi:hypothetical protein K2X05_01290 [bacterium]|nr:hypothetical protein [bacterium]
MIWNVGQGSWTSYISDDVCLHIDAGGDRIPFSSLCKNKRNVLLFTHYDWDHISLAHRIYANTPSTCLWQHFPSSLKAFKKKFLEKIPICSSIKIPELKTIYTSSFERQNESHAFVIANRLLITGDSDQKTEKKWLFKNDLRSIHFLLAGHHGSRTSIAKELLSQMPSLRMVLASCKKKKYGHPHKETIEKIEKIHRPLLITETFGSIAIEMD